MDVIYPRCAGLDVHAETIVACALWEEDGHIQKDIQTFSTFSKGLGDLLEWLEEHGVTHVAMESTGVYWKPVFAFLEGYV
ncbi:IS110 family transposase, partial [Geobacillus stearothermophilus]